MKVLLMGGSVFVGAAVRHGLQRAGHDLVAVTRGRVHSAWGGMLHIPADRQNANGLRTALACHRFDAVVDVSCYTGAECSTLLGALAAPPAIHILVSSAAVYDRRLAPPPFVETAATGGDPIWGDYGVEKDRAERVLLERSARGSQIFIFRPPYIYGPNNNVEREQFLWARILNGKAILTPGDGQTLMQFCHVEDLVAVIVEALGGRPRPGTYNIGPQRFMTIGQYLESLARACGRPIQIEHVADRTIAAREYFPFRDAELTLDTTAQHRAFACQFRGFDEGLQETFEWFSAHRGFPMRETEVEQRLRRGSR